MTAQLSDVVAWEGRTYAVAGIAGKGLFDPGDHGLQPIALSSACWRGFTADYAVRERALHLVRLEIALEGSQDYGWDASG